MSDLPPKSKPPHFAPNFVFVLLFPESTFMSNATTKIKKGPWKYSSSPVAEISAEALPENSLQTQNCRHFDIY